LFETEKLESEHANTPRMNEWMYSRKDPGGVIWRSVGLQHHVGPVVASVRECER
jgi:hypothetical protein